MLVNSFDTKYSLTAKKYESLDNSFTKILSANKKFSRIFTSVIEDKSLKSLSDATLRSDITGQVINTILTHDSKSKHFLYYMGDVFKKDKFAKNRDFINNLHHIDEIWEKLKLKSKNSSDIDLKNIVSNYCSVFTPNEKIEF